jgi:hypothetical protein
VGGLAQGSHVLGPPRHRDEHYKKRLALPETWNSIDLNRVFVVWSRAWHHVLVLGREDGNSRYRSVELETIMEGAQVSVGVHRTVRDNRHVLKFSCLYLYWYSVSLPLLQVLSHEYDSN